VQENRLFLGAGDSFRFFDSFALGAGSSRRHGLTGGSFIPDAGSSVHLQDHFICTEGSSFLRGTLLFSGRGYLLSAAKALLAF
jgi:hypothetical protein